MNWTSVVLFYRWKKVPCLDSNDEDLCIGCIKDRLTLNVFLKIIAKGPKTNEVLQLVCSDAMDRCHLFFWPFKRSRDICRWIFQDLVTCKSKVSRKWWTISSNTSQRYQQASFAWIYGEWSYTRLQLHIPATIWVVWTDEQNIYRESKDHVRAILLVTLRVDEKIVRTAMTPMEVYCGIKPDICDFRVLSYNEYPYTDKLKSNFQQEDHARLFFRYAIHSKSLARIKQNWRKSRFQEKYNHRNRFKLHTLSVWY